MEEEERKKARRLGKQKFVASSASAKAKESRTGKHCKKRKRGMGISVPAKKPCRSSPVSVCPIPSGGGRGCKPPIITAPPSGATPPIITDPPIVVTPPIIGDPPSGATPPIITDPTRSAVALLPPRGGGGWEVIEVAGGWIRFNATLGRADAHCSSHASCKMDRTCRNGTLGLSLLWLSCGVGSKVDHVLAKESCSGPARHGDRNRARTAFGALARASTTSAQYRLLMMERAQRDGVDAEPRRLACPSICAEVARAMS
jgi:hypothetical protein